MAARTARTGYPWVMRICVTGAGGKLGSTLVPHLVDHGHEVVATDAVYRSGLPCRLHLQDLLDFRGVYPLLEGCDAVVHAGNHPHAHAARPYQRLLAENVAMNANVFRAAAELGVPRVVFVSSIQVTTGVPADKYWTGETPACRLPYLPWDGGLPHRPGDNPYALSKCAGEDMLQAMCDARPEWSAAAVRFPYLLSDNDVERPRGHYVRHPLTENDRRLIDGLCYLFHHDACSFLRRCVEHRAPGYRAWLTAQTLGVAGMTPSRVAEAYFGWLPVRRPLDELGGLIDLAAARETLGWRPESASLTLEEGEPTEKTYS
ncbi:MAG: NAD(P)-dependent oxidoreductase [Planctomycetota bacterium]